MKKLNMDKNKIIISISIFVVIALILGLGLGLTKNEQTNNFNKDFEFEGPREVGDAISPIDIETQLRLEPYSQYYYGEEFSPTNSFKTEVIENYFYLNFISNEIDLIEVEILLGDYSASFLSNNSISLLDYIYNYSSNLYELYFKFENCCDENNIEIKLTGYSDSENDNSLLNPELDISDSNRIHYHQINNYHYLDLSYFGPNNYKYDYYFYDYINYEHNSNPDYYYEKKEVYNVILNYVHIYYDEIYYYNAYEIDYVKLHKFIDISCDSGIAIRTESKFTNNYYYSDENNGSKHYEYDVTECMTF